MDKRLYGTRLALVATIAAWSAVSATVTHAQSWPTVKAISVLNPAPAGGVLDNLLRSTSEIVAKRIGQSMVVESKSGGAGVPLAQVVALAPADGYVIGANYASYVINPIVMKSLPFDTARDFVPVTKLADLTLVWVAPTSAPYANIPELLKFARANPGKVSYGQPGMGGSTHFSFESFRRTAAVSIELIPYRGEAQVVPDILGERVGLALLSIGTAMPHVQAGKMKVLAVMTEKRLPALPNVATISEGLPEFKALPTWYGLYMRAGTPQAVVDRLAAEYRHALEDPAVKARLEAAGLIPVGSSPAEFAAQIRKESGIYADLIRETGFKLEQ